MILYHIIILYYNISQLLSFLYHSMLYNIFHKILYYTALRGPSALEAVALHPTVRVLALVEDELPRLPSSSHSPFLES